MKNIKIALLGLSIIFSMILFHACQKDKQESLNTSVSSGTTTVDILQVYPSDVKNEDPNLVEVSVGVILSQTPYTVSKTQENYNSIVKYIEDSKNNSKPYRITIDDKRNIVDVQLASDDEINEWHKQWDNFLRSNTIQDTSSLGLRYSSSLPSYAKVQEVFNFLSAQSCGNTSSVTNPCITFRYVVDGCYARAHKMKQIMESRFGYTCNKVFVFGNLKNRCGTWRYHVAPVVYVGSSGYILDPSMFSSPVSYATWKAAMTPNSNYYVCLQDVRGPEFYVPQTTYCLQNAYYADFDYSHTNYTLNRYANKIGCY